jgi:hypothetical protein
MRLAIAQVGRTELGVTLNKIFESLQPQRLEIQQVPDMLLR